MASALDRFEIAGIAHNVPFLAAIMHNPRFREGRLTTGFIAEEYPGRLQGRALSRRRCAPVRRRRGGGQAPAHPAGGPDLRRAEWRAESRRHFRRHYRRSRHRGLRRHLAVGSLHLAIDGKLFEGVIDWFPGRPLLVLKHDGQETVFQIARACRRLSPDPGRARIRWSACVRRSRPSWRR